MFAMKPRYSLLIIWLICCIVVLAACHRQQQLQQQHTSAVKVTETQQKQLDRLSETTRLFYEKVKEGDLAAARAQLNQVDNLIVNVQYKGITNVDGIRALSDAVVSARRALYAVNSNPQAVMTEAAKLRLCTDALTHSNQPMWLQYYKVLTDDTASLQQKLDERNGFQAKKALESMAEHYRIIRPAMIITRGATDAEKADSLFTLFRNELTLQKSNSPDFSKLQTAMPHWIPLWNEIFMKNDTETAAEVYDQSNTILWASFIAFAIMTVLAFSGWRIFAYERNHGTTYRGDYRNR